VRWTCCVMALVLGATAGCSKGSGSCRPGEEGCECRGDDSCDEGLLCLWGRCELAATGGAGATSGNGGTSAEGGAPFPSAGEGPRADGGRAGEPGMAGAGAEPGGAGATGTGSTEGGASGGGGAAGAAGITDVAEGGASGAVGASSNVSGAAGDGGAGGGEAGFGVDKQSCGAGLDCGDSDCCESLVVPCGTFPMGRSRIGADAYIVEDDSGDQPEHDVTLRAFRLDEFEVTVGRFRRYVEAYDGTFPPPGAGAHPRIEGSGWQSAWNDELPATAEELREAIACWSAQQTWTDEVGDREQFPINCISWYEAFAFCAWDGGRLPTEAEWEFAAAGGPDNRLYPWGLLGHPGEYAVAGLESESLVEAVGSRPQGNGRWGHADLAGSVWEWTLDGYHGGFYQSEGATGSDPAYLTADGPHVLRGGHWQSSPLEVRAAHRSSSDASNRNTHFGFRCARDVDEASGGSGGASGAGGAPTASDCAASTGLNWEPTTVGGYHVEGNAILNANDDPHLFRGVARPSFEWFPLGEESSPADYQLMREWGANVVRIAVNQAFWLRDSVTWNIEVSAETYRDVIALNVRWAQAAGLDVILDLHWSDRGLDEEGAQHELPDSNSVEFWTQVAEVYGDDSRVLFELYNEPFLGSASPTSSDWDAWLNGGETSEGFVGVGMQDLYDAVRGAGASNVVVIGGLVWASDLSGISTRRVQGRDIAYAAHPYDHGYGIATPAYWENQWGFLAATDPILLTEFGNFDCSTAYYEELIAYAASENTGWTAWAWYPGDCEFPSLITDWNGTPSAPGEVVRAALLQ
jgi:endoglucanase